MLFMINRSIVCRFVNMLLIIIIIILIFILNLIIFILFLIQLITYYIVLFILKLFFMFEHILVSKILWTIYKGIICHDFFRLLFFNKIIKRRLLSLWWSLSIIFLRMYRWLIQFIFFINWVYMIEFIHIIQR